MTASVPEGTATDGVQFPGGWNSWATTKTTSQDAEFGGGVYYFTPAINLTGDQEFKAYKGSTYYGNGYWVTGNNSSHVFTVNENSSNNKLCVTETGGGFTPSGAGYYTLRGWDTGSGIQYVAMKTSGEPVTITAASDNHATAGTGAVTVSATLSGNTVGETVYLRYTAYTDSADKWKSDNTTVVAMTGSGTSRTGTITAQSAGTTVEWYVFTSPHAAATTYPDLCTLRGKRDTGGNFTYTVVALVPEIDVESSHAFGSVVVGENKTETITVRNTGTAALTISGVTFSGTGSGQFTVTPTTATVAAGGSQNLSVKFSPTAVGSYSVTMKIANNDSDENPKSVTLTATGSVGTPVVTPGTVTKGVTTATVPAKVNAKGAATTVTFEYGTDTTYGTAGTVTGGSVAAGATAADVSVSLSDLKANVTYYYRWTANNGNSGTATGSFTTDCMSAGPVVTPTPGNGTATFTWTDVGAVRYLLSLWTGGEGSSTRTLASVANDGVASTEGWEYVGGAAVSGSGSSAYHKLTSANNPGLVSPVFSTVGLTSALVKSKSRYYSGTTDLIIAYSLNNGSTWTTISNFPSLSNSYVDKNASLPAAALGQTSVRIKWYSTSATASAGPRLQGVSIEGTGVFNEYVSGYGAEGTEVTSGVTVSGLTSGTTYNWSLKAVGGGTGCEEDGTPASEYDYTVTPTAEDVAPAWASTVGPWAATVSTLLSQDMTDYITAGSPAPTFTVAAQGTAPAGTFGVTSAGAFTFTAAEGDAGKSFTFRFTASNSQGNPTKDVVVNVAALAPTITEGSKTIGTTSATLPITVNMRGGATSADITLVYGKTTSYGSSASVSPVRITSGLNAGTAVTGTIASGLEPGTTYSYKWTVQNGAGTTTKTGTFTTLDVAPAVASAGSLNVTVNTGATATLAATGAGAWVTAGTHLTYALSTTVSSSLYTWTAGTGTLAFRPTVTGTYTFNLTASNGRGSATYAWTVTVANAPAITKGEASTSGTSATVPATIHAGGAATTVTFKYGTAEGTYNLNPASLSGGSVAAGATAAAASASLTGLTQGTTYYYQWTAVNAGGTTVETGSFFQPGDGLEFPGQMNGWAQSGTTTRDAEFGGGNYYYTPATRLTGDQLFKAYKAGTWYGNGDWVTGNNSGHVFTVNENTAENKLCVTETGGAFPPSGVGYYTLRGHDTGSGIEYVALYTENAPVTFTGASDNHAAQGTADVTVTATLSGAKSASEKVYLRYTTDGWSTSSLVQMSGSGTSYTGTIPGQGKGTTVEWYVLTSPHDAVADHVDLCTLRGMKNGTDNFTYTTALLPPRNCTATAGYEKVTLGWNLNAAGNAVMVIRYAGTSPSVTAPSDGTEYAANTGALGGTVVYGAYAHPSGSESLANVVSQGTGYTYVLYSVEGSGGSSKYSAGVTLTASTESLAKPTVGVTTAGAGTLTGAAAGKGEIYVVSRIAGSGTFSGTPSGAAPNAGQPLCGGTVVYKGTAGSFTVADMQGCQTYKYMAWLHAADEDAWSEGSVVGTVTMPTPAAPVLNAIAAETTTHNQFVATWSAVAGASKYRLDVYTGGAGSSKTDTMTSAWTGSTTSGSYASWSGKSDQSGAVYAGATAGGNSSIQMNVNTAHGIWTTTSGGTVKKVTVTWYSGTSSGRSILIYGSHSAMSSPVDGTQVGSIVCGTSTEYTFTTDYEYIGMTGSGGGASYASQIQVEWKTGGGAISYVSGYQDKDVGNVTTYTVTGLSEQTTYHVKVRAEGANSSCTSGDSNVEDVTTKEDTTVTTVTISDADGAGNDSAVAAGAVLAGQTVLLQGTKLVVASGTVNPTLAGLVFTTTGTATGSDVTTFRVRVGTSATYAGTETVKGTVSGGAAGSHTVTFGSAQTLTAGNTYYVWIEAVTASGATAGHDVKVGALTVDSYTTTGARKTGSTTAAGTKTIYGAPTVSLTPGASGSATISGTVGGLATGATVELRRYTSAEDAAGDTAGTAGTAVTVSGGAFEATGLEACRPYWFKARQTLDGFTGAWGAVQTASAPGLSAPTGLAGTATGAHSATLSWNAAAGALGYSVNVWHFEGGSGSEEATYTVTGTGTISAGGTAPAGSSAALTGPIQMTGGSSQVLTLSGFAGCRITGIKLSMKSNSSTGKGGLTVQVGSADAQTLVAAGTAFNDAAWHDAWSTSYVDIEKEVELTVGTGEDVVITIAASVNSLYCNGYTITYGTGTRVDDVTANATASGATATCTVSGTGATLANLTDNTTYYWSVAATGFGGCAGDGATGPAFKTDELLGAPVIVEPLTVAVEQLSGSITGAAGATMILKRYESEDAAMAGTADGSLGGVVVTTTPGAAGTWTFADTGLDGCKTYYYRAWQKATVDGEQATSAGSNVASGKTDLGTPTVNAVGAGTQMTISWNAVPGAVSYKVMLTDTEGVWTTTGGGSGTTQLSMDFAGITANNTELNTAANLTANGLTGWGATKVWTVVEEGEGATTLKYVKLGSGSAGGSLTTPQISAMSAGGKATFDLKTFTGGNGKSDSSTVTVAIKYTGDAGFEPLKTFTPSADWQNYQVSITGTKAFQLQLSSSAGNNRFHIDNLVVTENGSGGGTGGKVGLKYEATVTSAPFERTVDGLTMGETYWYKVIATGAEDCETTSAVGSGTPANAPLIEVTPMHYNFGTVTKNEGAVTADFIVRNTGSVALKFSSVTLVQDGDAYSITAPASGLTADLAAGASRTYTVTFNPTNSGLREATLRFANDAYNVTGEVPPASGTPTYGNLDIPLTGTCYDPATADPEVLALTVRDGLAVDNTVWDESMAHETLQPTLAVTAYHYNGMDETTARWSLYDEEGTAVLANQLFTAMTPVTHDARSCSLFTAVIPNIPAAKTYLGTYTVGVTLKEATKTYTVTTTNCTPVETGWPFDDFTRADAVATGSGALGNGWTAMVSGGAVVGEAAIHADALELYGANGACPGVAGRIAVARDMSDVGYATNPHEFAGTGSWGFHFKTGAKTVGFGDGSTAGAFVLGSTASTWLTATPGQVGYAVVMSNDVVQLVKFENSLLAGGTITQLGEGQFEGAQGKLLAVRVDYIPGQDEVDADEADDGVHHDGVPAKFQLYVKEVAATGGNPIEECTDADLVVEYALPGTEDHDLKFAGMMWNHGVAQVSDKTGAMFDDIYMPHMEGQTEPMMFHVIDEDTEGPEFYGISLRGAVAAPYVWANGLMVTGMVHDASGVAGTVAWAVYDGETLLTSGTATPELVEGSTSEYTLSCGIPYHTISSDIRSADCRFVLTASDGDDDRSENGVNIDSAEGTGSFPFTLCASTPTAPAWATAEADGAEMVVLRWARTAGAQYVVVRSDEEIGDNASPQGRTETMAEGTTVEGWGTVVYNGTGDNHLSGTWTAREFVVAPGSTNYFAVYGMTVDTETGHYFSAPTKPNAYKWETTDEGTGETTVHTATNGSGVPVASSVAEGGWPCTTAKYEPGEGVDAFAYRTSVTEPGDTDPQQWALEFNYETRPATGSGWGGAWTGDTDKWKVHDGSLLSEGTHYPAPTGNKLYWHDISHEESSSAEAKLTRPLKTPDSGEFYMAALMNYFEPNPETGAEGKWIQVALVDASGNDIVSFGMPGWDHNVAAIEYNGGQYCGAENIERDGYHLYSGHGNDYVVVGQLSRVDHKFRMWAYWGGSGNTNTIPELYSKKDNNVEVPVSVERTALNTVLADYDFGGTTMPAVAGIQLRAGSWSGKELGHVYFDEVRFANTWEELFLFNAPEVYTFDFDKPEEGTGIMVGLDDEGHRMWEISDGALAHGNVGLNAQFGLYHRTGIKAASFTILDKDGNYILKSASDLAPESGGTRASVALDGTKGRTYSDWSTPEGGATGVAVPKSKISLDETYTVEVTLKSTGGKEAVVTSASESGGVAATDLFFGEYGEGAERDKYVELYNASAQRVDLRNYVLARGNNNQTDPNYSNRTWYTWAYVAPKDGPAVYIEPRSTLVLLDPPFNTDDSRARRQKLLKALGSLPSLEMSNDVLDSGGAVPIILMTAAAFEGTDVNGQNANSPVNKPWLDACGDSDTKVDERFIMSRKAETTPLPRENLAVNLDEWDYRRWSYPKSGANKVDDLDSGYTNFVATAGVYDRNIGLGGNMEFKVYDDDTDAPVLKGGGVSVGGTRRAAETGERVYVMGAWNFTNYPAGAAVADLTQEDYQRMASMWSMGMTTNGGISWSPLLGDNLSDVLEATSSSGQSGVDFDGLGQVKRGDMLAKASNRFSNEKEVWLGFDLDVAKLSDAVLTFGYAGGPNGFQNGRVEVSTTGLDGSFKMPNEWDFAPQSGTNATTWTEWSRDLADAVAAVPEVATAGHLWFRVVLKNYKSSGGTFRMDNIRLEGAPEAVRVSDAELNTQAVAFDARVLDAASGLDADTATFKYGVEGVTLTKDQSLVEGGKSESTFTWSKTGGFEKAKVQEWYTNSLAGKTQLRVTISDKDDDRAGDALEMSSSYGLLDVYDDDAEPPVLEMETMKPRKEGVFAEWKPKEKTQTPSETMAGLDVSALELFTTTGRTSKPRYAGMGDGETKTYALYANGWQVGSKYWTTTISNSLAGAGTISRISFDGKVGNVLAPTGFRVEYGTVAHGAVAAESTDPAGTGSLLTTGDAWSKENDAEAGGSPIKTWKTYELEFATPIPLAAAGEEGDVIELRLFGTGADPDGIGAYWYLYDLKLEGVITLAEDGYTYVTDDSLAGGTTLDLRGSVYDEVSGLLAAPSFALTNVANSQVVSSGTISFSEEKDLSARKSKGDGAFSEEITLSSMGYGILLAEYKGGIHAEDADDDRGTAGEDKLSLDAQFAFTVVDQDLVGPTAPANVTVNGVAVPQTAPNRNNVTWTNKPEFLVAFDVAHDEVPTAAQLGDADWLAAHGVAASSVKKASIQNVATGVGEYRVALATDAVSLSNAPAFSVAATNGALANYGFERGNKFSAAADTGWANTDEDSGINKGNNVGGSYPVAEGTNSYYLRANAVASQIIPFAASASAQTLTVDLSLKIFKRAAGSIVYARFEFSDDEETWTTPTEVALNSGSGTNGDPQDVWLSKTMDTKALTAPAGAKYLRFSLRMNGSTANIDDVRLSVRVGAAPAAGTADRAMMRYVANAAAQGLNVKYLFAADADNNRVQDRRLGETATFYTAYDVTPPTAVVMNPETGASTEHVDDPTTQFDLTWNSSGVGPDDKDSPNGQAAGLTSNDALSPWYSYKIYYGAFDPEAWKGTTPASGASTTARLATRGGHVARATAYESLTDYINAEFIENEAYKTWNSVTRSSEVEDPSATGANYNTLGTKTTSSHRLYDLDFDQDYVVVIVGVDKAGNEGPATTTSWATNNTIKFAITQGVMRAEAAIPEAWKSGLNGADRAAALYWTASASDGQVKRTYDLIYRDARSFNESSNNTWSLVGTVQSNWFVDAGALDHDAGRIRFYRAAYENRWKDKVEVSTSGRRGETEVVTQRPLMSEDVYAMTAVPLVEGMNYVSLHGFGVGNGETNTLGAIFGTDPGIWPVGTRLDVFAGNGYTAGTIGSNTASRTYVLQAKASGQTDWYREEGGNVIELSTHVVNPDIFRHGVAINLPPITEQMRDTVITNNGTTYNAIYWHPVLLVPTNNYLECVSKSTDVQNQETTGLVPVDFTTQVKAGSGRTNAEWNLCAVNLPVACHPSQLGLERFFMPASGMHLTPDCDILYAYDSVTKSLRPGSGMFLGHASTNSADTNLVWRSIIGNNPEVHGHPFYPNDMIVILSRGKEGGEQDWEWTYSPTDFYTAPTRWGGW